MNASASTSPPGRQYGGPNFPAALPEGHHLTLPDRHSALLRGLTQSQGVAVGFDLQVRQRHAAPTQRVDAGKERSQLPALHPVPLVVSLLLLQSQRRPVRILLLRGVGQPDPGQLAVPDIYARRFA